VTGDPKKVSGHKCPALVLVGRPTFEEQGVISSCRDIVVCEC